MNQPENEILNKKQPVDMTKVAGAMDILFICLDTLRYDAACQEEAAGTTPVLNRYGSWEKCQAPGNFTYPSHHAMFAGFLPCRYDLKNQADRELLFYPKAIGLRRKVPQGAYAFSGSTIMEETDMIHGVSAACLFLTIVPISAKCFQVIFRKATGIRRLDVR